MKGYCASTTALKGQAKVNSSSFEEKNSLASDAVKKIRAAREKIVGEIRKSVIGQDSIIEEIVISLLSNGHVLLTGVPGLGKTLIVKSIAKIFSLDFKRIQFTPDLMPADIFGTEVLEEDVHTGKREFRFIQGPVFTNILLADEINRTPPKTQSALLEAMEERHVTAGGKTRPLDKPFFVLATQNPIELEGTYPLPEAQLDRFLLNVVLDYLPLHDEEKMVAETTAPTRQEPSVVFSKDDICSMQSVIREVASPSNVTSYAVRIVRATRPGDETAPKTVREKVKWGAGSRASQALILAGKARAILDGRYNVACEDVRALAISALRHRVIPNFHADAEGISAEDIISEVLSTVKE